MKINMTSKDGVTLLTAGKYCTEDIEVTPTFETGGESATVEAPGGTPVIGTFDGASAPTQIEVENIYFNTALSIDEVVATLSTLNYSVIDGLSAIYTAYGLNFTTNMPVVVIFGNIGEEYGILIQDGENMVIAFVSDPATFAEVGFPADFTGWNPTFSGTLQVNGVLALPGLALGDGSYIDNQQASYSNIMSLTPNFTPKTITLSGVYDGASISTTEKTVDIEALLNQKKLPLKVNVHIPLQTKLITPTEETQIVTPDEGYEGLSQVVVQAVSLQEKIILPTTKTQTVTPDENYNGLSKVTVRGASLTSRTITQNGTFAPISGSGFIGFNQVTVNISAVNLLKELVSGIKASGYINIQEGDLSGITEIRSYAFRGVEKLRSIALPNTVTSIGAYAFYGCRSLDFLTLPDSVTYIGEWAFAGCVNISTINIPSGVTAIEEGTFSGSTLMSIELPNGLQRIGANAFVGTYLESIIIPNGITAINNQTFSGCAYLKNITIPDSVVSIGDYAFAHCAFLNLVFPQELVTMFGTATFGCDELQLCDFRKVKVVTEVSTPYIYVPATCKIVVPDALYDEWIAGEIWSPYASQIVKASEYTE